MAITPYVPLITTSLLPRGNLLLQSQQFGSSPWAATSTTFTGGTTTDPDGQITGGYITRTSTGAAYWEQFVSKAATALTYTFSMYASPRAGGSFFSLGVGSDSIGLGAGVCFNVSTQTISLAPTAFGGFSNVSATISPVAGTGYARITLTLTTDASTALYVYFSTSSVSQHINGTGSVNSCSTFVWGAQLEPYANASAYAATVAAADPGIWAGAASLPVLPRLPGQAITVSKAPKWSTERAQSASGRVRKTSYWPYPLWQFELSYNVLRKNATPDELITLWEFFNVAKGQFANWLYVDPSDNYVPPSAPAVFGTGTGSATTFQLGRYINSWYEPVYAVYQPVILDNGVITASALTFTPNGEVTFTTPPANGHTLSWFGYYYFGCEFLQDDMTADQIVRHLWSGKSLKFSSLRI
jgi:hypothetical protein